MRLLGIEINNVSLFLCDALCKKVPFHAVVYMAEVYPKQWKVPILRDVSYTLALFYFSCVYCSN